MSAEEFLKLSLSDRYMYLSKILKYADSLPEEEVEAKTKITDEFNLLSAIVNN